VIGSPSVLLCLTGLGIDGGIASVNRSVVRVLEERSRAGALARVDRVLLQDDPDHAPAAPHRGEQRLVDDRQLRFAWVFWRMVRRHRPDRVFFDHVGLAQSVLLPLPSLPPRRYAVFVHGGELTYARAGRRAWALRGAWRILVNSEFTAGLVREAFPDRADRVRVVPLCIDPDRVSSWEALDASMPAPPTREAAALIVGRMLAEEPGKGHDELIEAWPAVLEAVPEARLWIVGGGDDRPRLERRVRELGLGHAVEFKGRVADEELHRLYRRASLFAMPSCQEGFGLVYTEAMWHGLPCLGSSADAASWVIRDGVTGRLVPYGDAPAIADAVGSMLSNAGALATMGEAGRREVETRFGPDQFREKLLTSLDLQPLGE
jgi:phosphatidylinositol alpha-1,6-mannosyltransferase